MKTIALRTGLLFFSLVLAALMAYGQEAGAKKVVKIKVIKDDNTVLDTMIIETGKAGKEDISRIIKTAGGQEVYVMVTNKGDDKAIELMADSLVKVVVDANEGTKTKHGIVILDDAKRKGEITAVGTRDHGVVTVMSGKDGEKIIKVRKIPT